MPAPRKIPEDVQTRFISLAAAERRSGLSEEVLRGLVRRGKLRLFRPSPGRLLLDIEELDRAILDSAVPV